MGLLDILDDEGMRLGINLLAAASPTMRPSGFGERLGLAMRGMDAQRDRALNNKLNQEHFDLQKSYKALQEQQMTAAIKQQERDAAVQEQFMGLLPGLLGGQPQAPQPMPLPQLGEAQGTGPYRLNVDTPEQRATLSKQLDYLSKNDPMAHQQVVAALVKQGAIPPPMMQTQAPQPDANAAAQLGMFGQMAGVKGAQGLYNYAKDFMRPDWQQIDSGGQIQFVNKNSGQMPTIGKTMSPDAMASNHLGYARLGEDMRQFDSARAPMGYRATPGGLEAIPGGPADLKTQALAAQKAAGASDIDSAIATLRNAYDRLEKGGGITSAAKSPVSNLFASSSASAPGQLLGKAFGTENQSARNDVAMTRPALLAALMKATGMSAKQMDSNAELKLWMATATDPTLDVEANRRALDAIERKYLGAQQGSPQSTMSGGGWSATILK